MSEKIEAPFTREQVEALNIWQLRSDVHPFTCPRRDDGYHALVGPDLGTLRADEQGWGCVSCAYRQTWAHAFMAEATVVDGPSQPW